MGLDWTRVQSVRAAFGVGGGGGEAGVYVEGYRVWVESWLRWVG